MRIKEVGGSDEIEDHLPFLVRTDSNGKMIVKNALLLAPGSKMETKLRITIPTEAVNAHTAVLRGKSTIPASPRRCENAAS